MTKMSDFRRDSEAMIKDLADQAKQKRDFELRLNETLVSSLAQYTHGNVNLESEFHKSSKNVQKVFLHSHSCILPDNYFPYLLLLQRISESDLNVLGRPSKSLESFFEVCGSELSTKQSEDTTVQHLDDYPYRIIVEFSLKRGPGTDSSYLLTWLILSVFETYTIDEYLSRRAGEAPESNICDMIEVLSHWDKVKKYPLSWAIELIRSDTVTI